MADRYLLEHDTIYHLVKKSAHANPEAIAQLYKADGKTFAPLTYRELYENVRRISAGLAELGLEHQEHVALIADAGPRWLWCSLGINCAGGVDVPRGTDATPEDLQYIFQHADCKFLFLENETALEKLQDLFSRLPQLHTVILLAAPVRSITLPGSVRRLSLDQLMELGARLLADRPEVFDERGSRTTPEDLAAIIYTSGTTGAPKGVLLTHKNLAWEAAALGRMLREDGLPFGVGDRTLGFLPPWHIGERMFETYVYFTGATIAFTSITTLSQDLQLVRPTVMFSVPRVWESFYNKMLESVRNAPPLRQALFGFAQRTAVAWSRHTANLNGKIYHLAPRGIGAIAASRALSLLFVLVTWPAAAFARLIFARVRAILGGKIRFAISGAGALPEPIDRLFAAIGLPIIEVYGMTETSAVSAARLLSNHVIGTVGRPIMGVNIQLRSETGALIESPGEKGVAFHRGPNIMKGYYKDPDRTAQVLNDGWLNSGDILVRTVQGDLKFAGRAKDTIVLLGGENIEPEPIEFALLQSPFVYQAMVVGQDQKHLAALIVPDLNAVRRHLDALGETAPDDPQQLCEHAFVQNLFKREIRERVSDKTGFKSFERVAAFRLLTEEFKPGVELTQTLKLRRNVAAERRSDAIAAMFR
jgi:long-chain acyl-CoA synthetase